MTKQQENSKRIKKKKTDEFGKPKHIKTNICMPVNMSASFATLFVLILDIYSIEIIHLCTYQSPK